MSQGYTPLRTHILNRLIDAGTWVSRDELNGLTTCTPALEDALADLVVDGLAEFRPNAGYRLTASPVTRRAAQMLRRQGLRHAAVGEAGREVYSIGVADTVPDVGLVLYELQVPNPEPGPEALKKHLDQVQAVVNFINTRGEQPCSN